MVMLMVMPQGIIFCPCLEPKCEQRHPSSIFGVSLMSSVIVAFRPAATSRYRYNLSRTWVGIVDKYKVTKIVGLPQHIAIVSEFESWHCQSGSGDVAIVT